MKRWPVLSILPLVVAGLFLAFWLSLAAADSPATQGLPLDVGLEVYADHVTFPVAMDFAPDGRLFVAERFVGATLPITGTIRVINDGVVQARPFATLDLPDSTSYEDEGLLGLALDPDFEANGYLYAYRTARPDAGNPSEHGEIIRYTAQLSGTDWIGAQMTVLVDDLPVSLFCCHNGGVLHFGPDGRLYLSIGDVSVADNGQNLGTQAGKLLRFNADGTIPADNPFYNTPGADPAIFAYGLRNVFGYDWHPTTGELYASDNGPTCNDELNWITAGGNYGWALSYQGGQCVAGGPGAIEPIYVLNPPTGLTGVTFYRSTEIEEFVNRMFMGSWNGGNLYQVELMEGGGEPLVTTLLTNCGQADGAHGLLDLNTGPDGRLYFSCQEGLFPAPPQTGAIYRLSPRHLSLLPVVRG